MKLTEALDIMNAPPPKEHGYLVHFERAENGLLHSDHFPDVHAGEEPIPTEHEAWEMAAKFASRTWKFCVNIYVIRSDDFTPVPGYLEARILNR